MSAPSLQVPHFVFPTLSWVETTQMKFMRGIIPICHRLDACSMYILEVLE
jgi:hypothetical protein